MKTSFFLSSILSILVLGNLQAQTEADEREMAAMTAKFIEAYNQKDNASLQKLYLSDAVIVQPSGTEISGTDQIGAYFAGQFKAADVTINIKPSSINWSDAEHAFLASGTYQIKGKNIADGKEINFTAAYANAIIKEGDEWKITKSVLTDLP